MNRMHRWVAVAAVAAVVVACGDGGNDSTTGPTNTASGSDVTAGANSQFSPSTITVAPGGSVTWVFGPLTHNVTFAATAGHPADIGDTNSASVSRTFNVAGTFTYTCTLHQGMNGTVRVQ